MGGYYTPKMKEIKEVMVPPLVHLSQTAPLAIFLGRKNWFDSRFFLVGHEFVWIKKKINSYGMFGGLPAPPDATRVAVYPALLYF